MSIKYNNVRNKDMLLKAAYENTEMCSNIAKEANYITEFFEKNEAYIFISKEVKDYYHFLKVVDSIALAKRRDYQIDIASFVNKNISIEEVLRAFISRVAFHEAKLFTQKEKTKDDKEKQIKLSLFLEDKNYSDLVKKLTTISEAVSKTRDLQITPPNIATSEWIAKTIKKDFEDVKGLSVKVLTKSEIEKLGMGLLLAVNAGSSYQPRVVIIEYNGNPKSKEKFVYVGKGITFDTGGYNTKGYHMDGMKFDMSGSAIVAYAVKAIAELEIKSNVAAVMMLTDNAIDTHGTVPESVVKSMSSKTVEITDTDAEGRLVLADGLYYGATKLNATLLVDVATLTGAMIRALGKTYSGIFSTKDERWNEFSEAAKVAHEKVWRLPMHENFHKTNKASLVADLNNYNNSAKADSNSAAMFLNEFTNKVDFIHCDVAGTADQKGMGLGVLVSTLVELAERQK
ncbi:leucyl aminopeptidase family protein [Metamycoplasma phocicerebrale]|uniref:Probable cytosol aminopeptidase n=1 Tax=Metamycoplasma phocicerebrale TaxID=142649 RepID=A0A3T0TUI5_9BACT|nr:M17 family metallopeptidase [Metamycoplasma phocicerebrale]AZZ65683.1 leucyl aminopeptidase family protein [Metamycoplasma phocicerebrale]